MSKYEHKPGFGSLFKNENKSSENHPDLTGSLKDLSGKDLQIAAWKKEGAKGPFYSFKIQEPRKKDESSSPEITVNPVDIDF